jgi:hypothetical protein
VTGLACLIGAVINAVIERAGRLGAAHTEEVV